MRAKFVSNGGTLRGVAVLTIFFLAPLVSATTYEFQQIVDSSGVYKAFNTSTFGPSINDHGDVLFTVELDNGHRRLELWTPEGTQTFATSTGLSPYRSGQFAFAPVFNNQREVIFHAVSFTTGSGIFTGPDPAVDRIIDQSSGPFSGFGANPAINDAGHFVIQATLPGNIRGLYRGPDPETDLIVDASGAFSSFGQVSINNDDEMHFVAFLDNETQGVFSGSDPVADRLVDSEGDFKSFGAPVINNLGDRLFRGELDSGVTGIYRGPDPIADRLVDTTMGFEILGGSWLNDYRQFLFGAIYDGGKTGIFSGPDPVADKIISTGDSLIGSTITALSSFKAMNNAGQFVFAYALANNQQGIVVATPVDAGDYNGDGTVDAADYTVWRDSLNQSGDDLPADGNGDGSVDEFDYGIWKVNFGAASVEANVLAEAAVPETGTTLWLLAAIAWTVARPRVN